MKRLFYDRQGKKHREYRAEAVEDIQGFPTVVKFSMTDLHTGGHTVAEYIDLKYNQGVPDGIFTEASLRRAPRKWLR